MIVIIVVLSALHYLEIAMLQVWTLLLMTMFMLIAMENTFRSRIKIIT